MQLSDQNFIPLTIALDQTKNKNNKLENKNLLPIISLPWVPFILYFCQ